MSKMSKYTTELRYICETYAGASQEVAYGKIGKVLDAARPKLFNFDYPIFDVDYKKPLELKIMRHFYMREIGLETVGQFKFFLEMKMNEIMPYYNQLYESERIKFDPLHDTNLSETSEKKGSGTDKKTTGETLNAKSKTDSEGWSTGKATGNESSTGNVSGSGTSNDKRTYEENIEKTSDDTKGVITGSKGTTTKSVEKDVTVTDTGETVNNGTRSGNGTVTTQDTGTVQDKGDNTKWRYFHDTPQGELDNITNARYLTNATKDTDDLSNTRTNNLTRTKTTETSGTSKNTQTVNGKTVTDDSTHENDSREESGSENVTAHGTGSEDKTGNDVVDRRWSDTEDSTGTVSSSGTSEGHTSGKVESESGSERKGNASGEYSSLDEYMRHLAGKSSGKSFSQMLTEFRTTFLNIDMMIINDLEELFMGVY